MREDEVMTRRPRTALVLPLVAAAALALAGCATAPTTPGSSPDPSATASEVAAAWLAGGGMVAVVTWGSSTCAPSAGSAVADGQRVSVELTPPAQDKACTMDYVPRPTLFPLPTGVDTGRAVTVVTHGAASGTAHLAALAGATPAAGEGAADAPSAGWFAKSGAVLLTWGSSSCRPEVQDVTLTGAGAGAVTVNFATPPADQVCTMDMAPRAQIIDLPDGLTAPATMTLTGDGLEGTVPLLGAP